MSDQSERLDQVLPDAAVHRLSNQITRACRGTYGAETGLRIIVKSVTRQLLHAGSSPSAVARAIENQVLNHPACRGADSTKVVMNKLDSRTLIELTRQCVADVALEADSRTLGPSGLRLNG